MAKNGIRKKLAMLIKGKKYETPQAKRTKKHKAAIEAAETLKRELSRPVETEEEKKKKKKKKKRKTLLGGRYSSRADEVLENIKK